MRTSTNQINPLPACRMVGLEVPRPSKPSCVGRGTDSRLDVGLCLVGPRTLLEVGSLVGALCVVGGGE
jgi:hypothetical protein